MISLTMAPLHVGQVSIRTARCRAMLAVRIALLAMLATASAWSAPVASVHTKFACVALRNGQRKYVAGLNTEGSCVNSYFSRKHRIETTFST